MSLFYIQWLKDRLHGLSGLRDKRLVPLRKSCWRADLSSSRSHHIRIMRKQSWHLENFQAIHTSWEGLRKDVPGFLYRQWYLGRHQRARKHGRKPPGWGQDKVKKGWQRAEPTQQCFPKQGGGITHVHELRSPHSPIIS